MKIKKVSIIISTYNRREALEKSLKSALGQDYVNIEVLVVDDGSTDDTESYIKSHFTDERIRFFRLSQNMGATEARNKGLDEANGEYTLVWDSDDKLDKAAVSTLVKLHERFPESAVVSAPTRVCVSGEPIKIPTIPEGELSFGTIICAKMPKYKLVRLVHVPAAGRVRYKGKNLDFMVNSELVECGKWIHTQQPLGDHFILSDNNSLTRKRMVPNVERSIERAPHLVAYLEQFGERLLSSCPSMYAAHVYGASLGLILSGNNQTARQLLATALNAHPKLFRNWLVYMLTFVPGSKHIMRASFKLSYKK